MKNIVKSVIDLLKTAVIIGGAIIVLAFVHLISDSLAPNDTFHMLNYWISFVVKMLLFLGVVFVLLQVREMKMINALNNECDPYKFKKLVLRKQKRCSSKRKQKFAVNFAVNLSLAEFCTGNAKKAIEILENIDVKVYPTKRHILALYYNNLFAYYLHSEDREKAKEIFDIHKYDMLYARSEKTVHSICETFATYEINFGNKEIGIATMNKLLERAINTPSKLDILLSLAKIDVENNELQAAKDKLNAVINEGNKLHFVDIAKELLAKI